MRWENDADSYCVMWILFISYDVHNYKAFYRQNGYLLAMQVSFLTNRKN